MKYLILLGIAATLLSAGSAGAVECRSIGGHLEGAPVAAMRTAVMKGSTLVLGGSFNSQRSPTRQLTCVRLHKGVLCGRKFGPVSVTFMSRGREMVETVTDHAGNEVANVAYKCSGSLKF